jgi:hypothetical protein
LARAVFTDHTVFDEEEFNWSSIGPGIFCQGHSLLMRSSNVELRAAIGGQGEQGIGQRSKSEISDHSCLLARPLLMQMLIHPLPPRFVVLF